MKRTDYSLDRLVYQLAYTLIRQQHETHRLITSATYQDNKEQLDRLQWKYPQAVAAARRSLRIREQFTPLTDFKVALVHRANVAGAIQKANESASNDAALYTVALSTWNAGLPSVATTRCATIQEARKVLQANWKFLLSHAGVIGHTAISNGYTLANLPAIKFTQTSALATLASVGVTRNQPRDVRVGNSGQITISNSIIPDRAKFVDDLFEAGYIARVVYILKGETTYDMHPRDYAREQADAIAAAELAATRAKDEKYFHGKWAGYNTGPGWCDTWITAGDYAAYEGNIQLLPYNVYISNGDAPKQIGGQVLGSLRDTANPDWREFVVCSIGGLELHTVAMHKDDRLIVVYDSLRIELGMSTFRWTFSSLTRYTVEAMYWADFVRAGKDEGRPDDICSLTVETRKVYNEGASGPFHDKPVIHLRWPSGSALMSEAGIVTSHMKRLADLGKRIEDSMIAASK